MSDSLQPHGLQYTRLPCLSTTPRVYSNSCPLSRWCHPTISSSVVPFSSHLQSFSTVQGICMSLLLPLTALAAHLACLRSLRELLANVHRKIMFSEKKNALPKPRWGKGTVGESNTVLFSHTHPPSFFPLYFTPLFSKSWGKWYFERESESVCVCTGAQEQRFRQQEAPCIPIQILVFC